MKMRRLGRKGNEREGKEVKKGEEVVGIGEVETIFKGSVVISWNVLWDVPTEPS